MERDPCQGVQYPFQVTGAGTWTDGRTLGMETELPTVSSVDGGEGRGHLHGGFGRITRPAPSIEAEPD